MLVMTILSLVIWVCLVIQLMPEKLVDDSTRHKAMGVSWIAFLSILWGAWEY